jgi:hypothetical protein
MNWKILKFKVFQQSSMMELDGREFLNEFFFCRLFPKDSDEVIDYQGERTLEGLTKFIDSNGKEAGKLPEEVNIH